MEKSKHLFDEICKVAYDLYEKRGRVQGYELEDWLEAEKIVLARHVAEVEKETKAIQKIRKKESSGRLNPTISKPKERKITTDKKEMAKSNKKISPVRGKKP